jgi:hypothetical protein
MAAYKEALAPVGTLETELVAEISPPWTVA